MTTIYFLQTGDMMRERSYNTYNSFVMTTIYFLQTGDMMREDLIIHITLL